MGENMAAALLQKKDKFKLTYSQKWDKSWVDVKRQFQVVIRH